MTNNEILRRVAITFGFDSATVTEIFRLTGPEVSAEQVKAWLSNDDDPGVQKCADTDLAMFLNGFIVHRRGKKEGAQPEPEHHIDNNIVFRKLKIALDLQAEDILEILELADIHLSKHELSAFFRKQGHKHYRECKDTVLRGFLTGVGIVYSGEAEPGADG